MMIPVHVSPCCLNRLSVCMYWSGMFITPNQITWQQYISGGSMHGCWAHSMCRYNVNKGLMVWATNKNGCFWLCFLYFVQLSHTEIHMDPMRAPLSAQDQSEVSQSTIDACSSNMSNKKEYEPAVTSDTHNPFPCWHCFVLCNYWVFII